ELLLNVSSDDDTLCFAHFGSMDNARPIIVKSKEQLLFWMEKISEWRKSGIGKGRMMELLLSGDPLLAALKKMPERMRARERYFIENNLAGIIGWIESREKM
ncbi:MAG: hypothetical protein FWG34_10730, partial [Oscillospiraceae bacterium]|nr:hypothetical protein [Oscillospiraceae bacterium]